MNNVRANKNQLQIIHLLLERMDLADKSIIDHQDNEGYTALHFAARIGSRRIAQEILKWGPSVNLQSRNSHETALHSALSANYVHPVLPFGCMRRDYLVFVEYMSSVVDVRIPDANGNTALHIALKRGLLQQLLDILLRGYHDQNAANVCNKEGRTALMEAMIQRNTLTVMKLFPITDINISDVEGKTALHYAVEMRFNTFVNMALKRNVNLLARDTKGNTALALACCLDKSGHNNHVQLSMIFQLYRYGVAYGEQANMI